MQFKNVWFVQLIVILPFLWVQPACAEELIALDEEILEQKQANSSFQLNELNFQKAPGNFTESYSTSAKDLLAQETTSIVRVTGVRLNETPSSLQVILETPGGGRLQPLIFPDNKTLIIDLLDAVLALPESEEFRQTNPAEGISEVTVRPLDATSIRITITGEQVVPTAEVVPSRQNLVLSVEPSTETPQTPQADEEIEVIATGEGEASYFVPDATTATKTDTPLRDIPQSIQVIPEQVWRDRRVIRVGDVLQNVSGAHDRGGYQGFSENFEIRGFPANTFRDGIRVDGYISYLETANLERIEVLKGPASVLFGDAEPGGLVNLVSKRPLENPFYSVEANIGSYGTYRGTLDFSGPLDPNRTALYRFISFYENAGSFRDFVTNERLFLAPTLTFALTPRTALTLDLTWTDETRTADDGIPAIGNRPANLPRNRFLGEPFQNIESDVVNLGYFLEHQFSDRWSINNLFRAQWVNLKRYYPLFDSLDEETGELSRLSYFSERQDNAFSSQTNVIGRFSTGAINHQLLLGFEYTKITEDGTFGDFEPYPSINIFDPVYARLRYPKSEIENFFRDDNLDKYGFYLQDQIELLPNLKLLAGGRFDIFRQTRTTQDLGEERQEFEQSDRRFSPRIGLVYQPIEPISLYASYTTSFAPSFGTSRNVGGEPFEPETGRQFEVGVKTELNQNLSTTLALYDLRKQNIVVDDPASPDPDASIQVGEQASRGVELDITGEILPGWNVIAAYAYTDAFISKDTTGLEGQRRDNVPENLASLWTTYEIQKGRLQGLGFGLGVYFVGDRFGDIDNSFVLPSYVRTDAALFYRRNNWRAGLNIRNLFDKTYFTGSDGGRTSINIGQPFTVIGSFAIEF
ncbi:TonB-dependent siderophore receptor [Pleurocapsales cyanobacterium LEGE 06147]|nr:TonB-dependent siderophore receptor [Pleurocapsales cyanobacterium LEGE 06147]